MEDELRQRLAAIVGNAGVGSDTTVHPPAGQGLAFLSLQG